MGSGSEIVSIINSNSLAEDLQTLELVRDREVKKGFVKRKDPWRRKKKNQVLLEGYVETSEEEIREQGLANDLDELKGCLGLWFGLSYEEIPENQRFLDDQQQKSPKASTMAISSSSALAGPITNWKISSPGFMTNLLLSTLSRESYTNGWSWEKMRSLDSHEPCAGSASKDLT